MSPPMSDARLLSATRLSRVLVRLAIAATLTAASGSAHPAAAGPVGFVAGTITDATTGNPIGSALVAIFDDEGILPARTFPRAIRRPGRRSW
jgi:hypothetical protein